MSTIAAHPVGPFAEPAAPVPPGVAGAVAAARAAQRAWAARPLKERLHTLRRLRHAIGIDPISLSLAISSPSRTPAEKLASEVLPLADAIRFLERDAPRLLRPRRYGRPGRPLWLGRVHLEVRREPLGVVLVVSPSNYPLLLAGVQAVQALAAGNAVLVKPAPGHAEPVRRFAAMAAATGIDPRLVVILGEEPALVAEAAAAGVDKVALTGSAETGQAVLATLAPHLTPSVMELSGHDAVLVCDGADLDVVAKCVAYGLTFNAGATCIAPRRVFVRKERAADLEAKLVEALAERNDTGSGRTSRPDTPSAATPAVSILPVRDMDHALALSNECPYRLGAAVFGPAGVAHEVAGKVDAGCVVVNDVIVPTADPRLPFGGRGRSGFGVTRGAEGLLEMTRVKAVATRGGSFRPHLDRPHPLDGELFRHYAAAAHGPTLSQRLRGAAAVASTLLRRSKS